MNARCRPERGTPTVPVPPARSVLTVVRVNCRAGSSPNTSIDRSSAAEATNNARELSAGSRENEPLGRGRSTVLSTSSTWMMMNASTPPSAATMALSTHSSRTSRQREAPSARRMANSCCRSAPRASIRFARFVQATTRTRPTRPSRSVTIVESSASSFGAFTSRADHRRGVTTCAPSTCRVVRTGNAASRRPLSVASSVAAAATVRPGARRPTTDTCRRARSSAIAAFRPDRRAVASSGIQKLVRE